MHVLLETERLRLRAFAGADLDNLREMDGDPEVMRFLDSGQPAPELLVTRYAQPSPFGYWAAEERDTAAFIGWFEFRPVRERRTEEVELGYRLRRAAWGKGYATEGARALVRRGFTELGVVRVTATTMAVNTGSRRVLEKCGLRYVRTFHEEWAHPLPGAEHGDVEYALTAGEWRRPGTP
ncbi:GNAT family N-acetyltransferase [Streptomyces purpurogeneiscleroticus]|uniref:GNAT family N-acetyltransferase n=1 Tax=Streptomyces purpurogeneiscleroticus TaxID=68259 RepID=UPI001CBED03E|nr:GNAT family N-acetyltransferase [Streptomyces purpurogeneiscleroticus]MBZ4015226.1 GNAT family N-acetyltransferase [Streptomyces purpurogeneiscleroticus]